MTQANDDFIYRCPEPECRSTKVTVYHKTITGFSYKDGIKIKEQTVEVNRGTHIQCDTCNYTMNVEAGFKFFHDYETKPIAEEPKAFTSGSDIALIGMPALQAAYCDRCNSFFNILCVGVNRAEGFKPLAFVCPCGNAWSEWFNEDCNNEKPEEHTTRKWIGIYQQPDYSPVVEEFESGLNEEPLPIMLELLKDETAGGFTLKGADFTFIPNAEAHSKAQHYRWKDSRYSITLVLLS